MFAVAIMGTGRCVMAQVPPAPERNEELAMSLEQLFRTAEEHNTSIKSFQSAIQEAEAGVKAAKLEQLPDVDASLSFSYLGGGWISDRDFKNAVGIHIPHYGSNLAIQASWAVYTGGAIRSGINLSKLQVDMAQTNAQENRQRVRMLLTGHYLQLHNLKNQQCVFDENIALTETLIEQTRKRQSEGVVLKNDIIRYELQLEQQKLARTQVQNQAKIVNHQLVTALGIEEDISILPTEVFEAESDAVEAENAWQQTATYNAPALKQAQLGIEMSQQKERLEKSARRPKLPS